MLIRCLDSTRRLMGSQNNRVKDRFKMGSLPSRQRTFWTRLERIGSKIKSKVKSFRVSWVIWGRKKRQQKSQHKR